ncbi:MAG: Rv0909 family putative TA system antitoxin [Ancrocorticia sp.]|uniref:Rv0909 family putative TA system antitoxin n=1 Tax=Ancrocorticia sp. TaxID=2593684 RepID=UPI003F91B5FB
MDLANKAKDFLNSDQAETKSDQVLDQAAGFAKEHLGEDKVGQINKVRDAVDAKIGNEGRK